MRYAEVRRGKKTPDVVHELHRELWLPHPLDEVFAFFSAAGNLELFTPRVLTFASSPHARFRCVLVL
jgi:hypothetical protein